MNIYNNLGKIQFFFVFSNALSADIDLCLKPDGYDVFNLGIKLFGKFAKCFLSNLYKNIFIISFLDDQLEGKVI